MYFLEDNSKNKKKNQNRSGEFVSYNSFLLHLIPLLSKSNIWKFFTLYYEKKTLSRKKIDKKSFLSFNILIWYSYIHLACFEVMYIKIKNFDAIWDTLMYNIVY